MDDATATHGQLTLPFGPLEVAINEALHWRLHEGAPQDLTSLLGTDAHRRGYYRAKRSGWVPLLLAESICDHLTWHPQHLWPGEYDQLADLAVQLGSSGVARRDTQPVDLPPGVEHGVDYAYRECHCSCDTCRAATTGRRRKYRAPSWERAG